MSNEGDIKQIMLNAIMRDEEAGTISLRSAGAVVNAIFDALDEAHLIVTTEKQHPANERR